MNSGKTIALEARRHQPADFVFLCSFSSRSGFATFAHLLSTLRKTGKHATDWAEEEADYFADQLVLRLDILQGSKLVVAGEDVSAYNSRLQYRDFTLSAAEVGEDNSRLLRIVAEHEGSNAGQGLIKAAVLLVVDAFQRLFDKRILGHLQLHALLKAGAAEGVNLSNRQAFGIGNVEVLVLGEFLLEHFNGCGFFSRSHFYLRFAIYDWRLRPPYKS